MTTFRGALLIAVALLTGCARPVDPPSAPQSEPSVTQPATESAAAHRVRLPPTTGSFDYQLGGAGDIPGLAVVVRDASARPMPGAYSICYLNGFQTQPGDGDSWLHNRGEAVLRDAHGSPVRDPDWPDEYVLDPSTAAKRSIILGVLTPVLSACADKGFDAIDLDNFDTFRRFSDATTGHIDEAGAVELARSFTTLAHDRGLAVAQKNTPDAAEIGRRTIGFDFAVAEECAAYQECDHYRQVYGPHVLQIEYTDNLAGSFRDVCATADRAPLTILRDRRLVTPGSAGYVREQCP